MKHSSLIIFLLSMVICFTVGEQSFGLSFDSIGESLQNGMKSIGEGIENGIDSVEKKFSGEEEPQQEELSSNIMRRVNAANEYLNKAEEQIRTGRAEHAPGQIAGAQQEYDNIFAYYKGSFDPEHPTLVALKKRIDSANEALSAPESSEPPISSAVSQDTKQSTKTSQTSSTVSTTMPTREETAGSELSANIRRRLNTANTELDIAFKLAAKGEDASVSIDVAKNEYANIFNYYKGSFDPDHPDIVALKNRINEAEQAMNEGIARKDKELPIETNRRVVSDLPSEIGEALLGIGEALYRLENLLNTAKQTLDAGGNVGSYMPGLNMDLKDARDKLSQFDTKYKGKFDTNHVAYQQVTRRLKEDADEVSGIEQQASAYASAQNSAQASKYSEKAQEIMNKYEDQAPTSNLHKNNIGRMVWSKKPINFKDQDHIKTQNSFKLTDPIFGRLYLARSIGNTPVYSRGEKDSQPSDNYEFRYVYRLYIDGEEKVDKFGVFIESKLNGEAGETWTTFQFSPNPIPYDQSFSNEAEAWRRVTNNLAEGTHEVRFELWGQQGQFWTLKPVAVGEFSLLVSKGDKIAPGMQFPGDTYSGKDLKKIRKNMRKALVGPVAKNNDEILKISVTSDWRPGVYRDSKNPYRKISGTILWHDTDNDGICRFTSVNFISDSLGGNNWTPVRYNSFMAGPEGDVQCP